MPASVVPPGWFNAASYGNNKAAIQTAVNNAAAQGGGIAYCHGVFREAAGGEPAISVPQGVRVVGSSVWGAQVIASNDTPLFSLSAHSPEIENIRVQGYGLGATQPAIVVQPGASQAKIRRVEAWGGFNVLQDSGADTEVCDRSFFNLAYGDALVKKLAGNCWYHHCGFDQDYPVSDPPPGTIYQPWAANAVYSKGTVVKHPATIAGLQFLIQCSAPGTSGSTAPALQNYEVTIQDGSAQWLLVGSQSYVGLLFAGGSQFSVTDNDITFMGSAGLQMAATSGGSGFGSIIRGNTFALAAVQLDLEQGAAVIVDGNTFVGGIGGMNAQNGWSYAILLQNVFGGDNTISNNQITGVDWGIYLNADSQHNTCGQGTTLTGNTAWGCRQAAFNPTVATGFKQAGNSWN
jgi:hypothetical protein